MDKKLNVVLVSTFRTMCGIAEYTAILASELVKQGHSVTVLSELNPTAVPDRNSKIPYYPCWNRKGHLLGIVNMINSSKVKPDVIHFQHEFGLFNYSDQIIKVQEELLKLGIIVVTTFHTVLPDYDYNNYLGKSIVHSVEGSLFVKDAHIIPHGVKLGRLDKTEAKIKLFGHEPPIVCLIPGFISKSKRTIETAMVALRAKTINKVIIAGECKDDYYLHEIMFKINTYGNPDKVVFEPSYISDEKQDLYLRASDFVLLGRSPISPYSASGQMALAFGYGKAIIAQDSPIHRDDGVLLFREDNTSQDLNYILNNLNERTIGELSFRSLNVGLSRSWDKIAKRHVEEVYI